MNVPLTIQDVSEFYLAEDQASFHVWLPGLDGRPQPVIPAPPLTKAAYASGYEVRSGQLQSAQNFLNGPYPLLMHDVPHSFGAPFRAVRIFSRYVPPIPEGSANRITYLATTSRVPYRWTEDLGRAEPGYFLTGLPNASELWEISSCERDPADRCVFVLSPVRLPHGLPTPDFTEIADPILRTEAQQHWTNLEQAVVAHNPYALVNSAASLSEALLRIFLAAPGPARTNLSELLDSLKKELDKSNSAFSPLSYHFMQAVRIMHQSTQHPGRVAGIGRPINPRLALSVAEGMVEVLASVGLV
jgi:hypothetical protein